jgi:hypothetical protein
MSSTIEITDVGPVQQLSIPVPDHGGLVVLRGGQGVGKSTALKAVRKTLGAGRVKGLSTRDGARRGVLELGDARLTVTRARTMPKGELAVAELESRLDISALVDPGIDDPERADMTRIKALLSLSGVKADAAAYYDLVGGRERFESIGVDTDTDDPVLLATRVKRALELEARKQAKVADTETGRAKACEEQVAGVNLEAPCDEDELQRAYDEAKDALTRLEERRRVAEEDAGRRTLAEASLKKAEANYDGSTVADAQKAADDVDRVLTQADEHIEKLRKELAQAESMRHEISIQQESVHQILEAAKQHERVLEEWRATLQRVAIEDPGDKAVDAAGHALLNARRNMQEGVRVRDAKRVNLQRTGHEEKAKQANRNAQRLRDAARATDDVLSQAVPSSVLRVEGGRLVTATDRSQSEPYAELSRGEQWKIAIDLACEQLPENGLLVVPQESFEGLQPKNRKLVHEHAVKRRVTILTAEATDGELEAAEYSQQ